MEVTNAFFASTNAQNALQELYGTRFDTETTLKISKLKFQFDKYAGKVRKEYEAIMLKHAVLSEMKNFIPADNIFGIKFKEGGYELALKEANEFESIKVELPKCSKIPLSLIKEISSNELMALAPIIEGMDLE